ncbi:hypothetical protein OUZ56_022751 [Daphnia magna]|uniref:Uncharacterized protein n=1 Tax=Daphnia magna TaxID=35525 RepID=A0ABR0AXM2_9CRUS|nr:hypothetical protein OUZ56_022751 [Daphnia magna]
MFLKPRAEDTEAKSWPNGRATALELDGVSPEYKSSTLLQLATSWSGEPGSAALGIRLFITRIPTRYPSPSGHELNPVLSIYNADAQPLSYKSRILNDNVPY